MTGDYAYFAGKQTTGNKSSGLWVTDGTPEGTLRVNAGGTDLSSARAMKPASAGVIFTIIRADDLEVWTIKPGRTVAKRAFVIESTPLTGGHVSYAEAKQVADILYVTAHVYLGSRQRNYLWAVYSS